MIEIATLIAGLCLVCYGLGLLPSREALQRLGALAMIALSITLLALLVLRGLLSGHWPLGTQYEFTLAFAWIVSALYATVERLTRERRGGAGVALVLVALLIRLVTTSAEARAMGPLPEALQSGWLQAHVLAALVGYGCVTVAAGLGLVVLVTEHRPTLPRTAQRLIAIGWGFLTLGILGGALWAHHAWGRYWAWDPKETWSLITWLWYLGVVIVGRTRSDRQYAWLALGGLALVLFTLAGVPAVSRVLSLETLHGY